MELLPQDIGNNEIGIVCAANESRFSAANYSEPLTAFTVGWRDREDIEGMLDFLAPAIPVGKRFEFKKSENGEAFLSEDDDVRAVGAAFKRVDFSGTSVMGKTLNKGLTVRVDHDDAAGDDWRERHVQALLKRLYRNELRRAIAALNAASEAVAKLWTATANPDGDLRLALAAATDEAGIRPNRILFGEGAWDIRANVYDGQDVAAAQRAANMGLDELARKLFVDAVRVFGARYQSTSATKTSIVGNDVYIFSAHDGIIKDEPANIKRFVTPVDGNNFRVYVEEHSKYTDITVEHYSNIMVTSPAGIVHIEVTDSNGA
ncbi:MAG: hypothetical protein LBB38_01055 [Puniceicoccales bacterium]|jgi:hypothetical protein|nr:hypothetical protein [Puniceicoccales bacterium]